MQNKEAEAKEELKRRAKQLEIQRREQQRRAAGAGGGGTGSYLGGGVTGYSAVPRFEAPDVSTLSNSRLNTTSSSTPARSPAFKGSGMKLGSKKTKQAELLDALGGDVLATTSITELSAPAPAAHEPPAVTVQKVSGRGSLPEVEAERCVVSEFFLS